jgi:hypothetical protein
MTERETTTRIIKPAEYQTLPTKVRRGWKKLFTAKGLTEKDVAYLEVEEDGTASAVVVERKQSLVSNKVNHRSIRLGKEPPA